MNFIGIFKMLEVVVNIYLSLRSSEALEPQAQDKPFIFFELVVPCTLSKRNTRCWDGICVAIWGLPQWAVHMASPQYSEGWLVCLLVLALSPFLWVRARWLFLMYKHWWRCPFSSRDIPNQVRGEADRGEREAKEQGRKGGKTGHVKWLPGRRKKEFHADIVFK